MCRCVKKARKLQYHYVGIRFYAECFGVKDGDLSKHIKEKGCFQYEYDKERECEEHDEDECAGSTSEYIYELLPESKCLCPLFRPYSQSRRSLPRLFSISKEE